jgi:hypothetical protein
LKAISNKILNDVKSPKFKIQIGWAVDTFKQFLCTFPCSNLYLICIIHIAYTYLL